MKILVVYTGGTIGMIQNKKNQSLEPGGVIPIKEFLKREKLFQNIDIVSFETPIDSSNFGLETYNELATVLEKKYNSYDSFLILMGTDTMAYVSSLLSYCIDGLSKPILFTGGQESLYVENSDSIDHLKESIEGLKKNKFPKEVGVYFAQKWFRSVSVTKIDAQGKEAYSIPYKNDNVYKNEQKPFAIEKTIEAKIGVIQLIPFGNEEVLGAILESNALDGLVLETFGAGNMPDFSPKLKKLFTIKVKKGLKVVLVSQCLKAKVSVGRYQSSLMAQELDFVSAGSLTTESTVAKMMYLHPKKLNIQQYQSFFEDSIRGE